MPAVLFREDAFDTEGPTLVGLQAANREFLNALVRDEHIPELSCYVPEPEHFTAFEGLVAPHRRQGKDISCILYGDYAGLARAGVLHLSHPVMAPHLWQRRYGDQRLYSLTGVIHSISSQHIMEAIGDLVIAPFQAWDALVCTSKSGRDAVTKILNGWADYLAERLNAHPHLDIALPVIPLGVDFAALDPGPAAAEIRSKTRAELGIGDGDIAVLFVGRLAFRRKCHPVPMYLALQRAQQATGARLHFIQAGKFEDERESAAFQAAAAQFCPDVRTLVVGGSEIFRDRRVWLAGDMFLSLSDNIQETFGLTPVEAMAVGLPAVVSDWNGYRDTVRDGVDGFLIPTTLPAAGDGLDVAARYHEFGNFRHYYGVVAMSTAIDIDACAEALARLIRDPALRFSMGQNGRQRVRAVFDWLIVLNAYRRLWENLAEARRSAAVTSPNQPGRPPYPLCDDPFRVFGRYASAALAPETRLSLTPGASTDCLELLHRSSLTRFGSEWRLEQDAAVRIIDRIGEGGTLTTSDLAIAINAPRSRLHRAILYMLKFGLLRTTERP